ncbi:hypothetical protein WUBG_15763, partial [Wuchereria bancrofti]
MTLDLLSTLWLSYPHVFMFSGELRIHDPRIRRGGSRGSMARNGDDERSGGSISGTQVRDPRRRPQLRAPTASKQVCCLNPENLFSTVLEFGFYIGRIRKLSLPGVQTLTAVAQMGAAGIPLPALPMPPAIGPLIWPPPIPANLTSVPPASSSSIQNRDVDYRTGPSSLPMPPLLQSNSTCTSNDVDLRNQQPSSSSQSQSWRSSAQIDSKSINSDETSRTAPSTGELRIHDPRIRRGGSRGSMARNGDDERSGGSISGTQVRDPRRRPQLRAPTASKQ